MGGEKTCQHGGDVGDLYVRRQDERTRTDAEPVKNGAPRSSSLMPKDLYNTLDRFRTYIQQVAAMIPTQPFVAKENFSPEKCRRPPINQPQQSED